MKRVLTYCLGFFLFLGCVRPIIPHTPKETLLTLEYQAVALANTANKLKPSLTEREHAFLSELFIELDKAFDMAEEAIKNDQDPTTYLDEIESLLLILNRKLAEHSK